MSTTCSAPRLRRGLSGMRYAHFYLLIVGKPHTPLAAYGLQRYPLRASSIPFRPLHPKHSSDGGSFCQPEMRCSRSYFRLTAPPSPQKATLPRPEKTGGIQTYALAESGLLHPIHSEGCTTVKFAFRKAFGQGTALLIGTEPTERPGRGQRAGGAITGQSLMLERPGRPQGHCRGRNTALIWGYPLSVIWTFMPRPATMKPCISARVRPQNVIMFQYDK
jgi:hypothetical protein